MEAEQATPMSEITTCDLRLRSHPKSPWPVRLPRRFAPGNDKTKSASIRVNLRFHIREAAFVKREANRTPCQNFFASSASFAAFELTISDLLFRIRFPDVLGVLGG